jgi:transposase
MADIFDLQEWRVLRGPRRRRAQPGIVFRATYAPEPEKCAKCREARSLRRHGRKSTTYRDLPNSDGMPVMIEVDRHRYRCASCEATSLQPLPDMDDRYRMTRRLVEWIETEAVRRPFLAIAGAVGIHEKTVRRVVEDRLPDLRGKPRPVHAPLMLSVSQVNLQGRLRAIMVDVGNLIVLDVLPSIQGPGIARWLAHLAHPERVQVVSIGLRSQHRSAVRKALGSTVILVVEKQGFIQLAEKSVDAVRRTVKRQSPARRPTVGNGRLEAAQDAQRRLVDIYDRKSSQMAHRALADWKTALAPSVRRDFGPLLAATDAWAREMIAFFDKRALTTNLDALTAALDRFETRFGDSPFESARLEILSAPTIKAPAGFRVANTAGATFEDTRFEQNTTYRCRRSPARSTRAWKGCAANAIGRRSAVGEWLAGWQPRRFSSLSASACIEFSGAGGPEAARRCRWPAPAAGPGAF